MLHYVLPLTSLSVGTALQVFEGYIQVTRAVGKLLDDALLSGDGYIGITHTSSTHPMCLFYHVRIIGVAGGKLFIVRHQFGWMVKEHPNELNRMNLENFLLDNVTTVLMARMVGKNRIFAENCHETAMIEIPCKWVAEWSTIFHPPNHEGEIDEKNHVVTSCREVLWRFQRLGIDNDHQKYHW